MSNRKPNSSVTPDNAKDGLSAHLELSKEAVNVCPTCSTMLEDKHGALVCPVYGYFLSCSGVY